MENIRSHFISERYNTKRMAISHSFLKMIKFTGARSVKFDAQRTEMMKAYNLMYNQGQDCKYNIKVKQLHGNITASNNREITMAK